MPRRKGRSSAPVIPKRPVMTEMDLAVEQVAGRKITARKDGKTTEMTMKQAIVETLGQSALKGGAHATRQFLEQVARADEKRRAVIEDDNETWALYKRRTSAEIAAAVENGEPEPEILPHPDDVVIDAATGVRFDGPFLKQDLLLEQNTRRLIDAFLLQDALDRKLGEIGRESDVTIGDSFSSALYYNRLLCRRLAYSESQIITRRMRLMSMSKRELLKQTYRAFKAAGVPRPRGAARIPPQVMTAFWKMSSEALVVMVDKDMDKPEKTIALEQITRKHFG